ncbi:MAG TPA: MOSC N-terminal beta barrel domain-containing protein [Phnomibacter sp.]|nr:MOSC N-terminal beta barrel domain-containing protein [Phnomibacter sp.]
MQLADPSSAFHISELWLYPVKSLGGIAMDEAKLLPKGFEHDRRWMLIDENNACITQRVFPQLALFKLSFHEIGFVITCRDVKIILPIGLYEQEEIMAQIWDDTVEVFEVSAAHSAWFSSILKMPCRLVYFPDSKPRPVDPDYAKRQEQVSLADAFPMLIIGQSSLDDLNSRLDVAVPMNRFRPNIVFTGGAAFEEDGWIQIEMGANVLNVVKPCARCVLTTVDQDTAEKGLEPLATLSSYRKQGNKVMFGQNVLPVTIEHSIRIGDAIHVRSKKNNKIPA